MIWLPPVWVTALKSSPVHDLHELLNSGSNFTRGNLGSHFFIFQQIKQWCFPMWWRLHLLGCHLEAIFVSSTIPSEKVKKKKKVFQIQIPTCCCPSGHLNFGCCMHCSPYSVVEWRSVPSSVQKVKNSSPTRTEVLMLMNLIYHL